MKKLFALLLVVGMLVCFAACGDEIGEYKTYTTEDGNFTYELVGEEATVITYNGTAASVTIPATADEYPIVGIGSAMFRNQTTLTTVVVEGENLRAIGSAAFYGCEALTSVTLPKTVTTIGEGAFYGCKVLSTITETGANGNKLPTNLTTIESSAFYGCTALAGVTMDTNVTAVGKSAFEGCTSLATMTFSAKLTTIDDRAYANCAALVNIVLPDSLETIGNNAFESCKPTSVRLPKALSSMGETVFKNCTTLSNVTFDAVSYQDKNGRHSALLEIGSTNLTLNIGPNVLRIPAYAFTNLPATTITFAENGDLTTICSNAFRGCTAVTALTIPDSVTSIEEGAFALCGGLQSINLPFVGANLGVDQSGAANALFGYVFGFDSNYEDKTATKITQVFGSATNDKRVAYIPAGLTTVTIRNGAVAYNAFDACTMITNLTMGEGVTSVVAGAIHDTAWFTANTEELIYVGKVLYAYKAGATPLTTLTVADGIVSITAEAFRDCTSLTTLNLPASLSAIGARAFAGCSQLDTLTVAEGSEAYKVQNGVLFSADLTELVLYPAKLAGTTYTIPETITTILESAFADNSNLTTITIPASVTAINAGAFANCTALTEFVVDEENGSYAAENGILFNSEKTQLLTYPAGLTATKYDIPQGIARVDAYAFEGAIALRIVTIPTTVTMMGDDAFAGCDYAVLYAAFANKQDGWADGFYGDSPAYYGVLANTLVEVDGMQFVVNKTLSNGVIAYSAVLTKYVGSATTVNIPATISFTPDEAAEPIQVTVVKVGKRAFSMTNVATISFASADLRDFGNGAFSETAFWNNAANGIVYLNNVAIGFKGEMPENYVAVIADGTTAIGYKAFYEQANLTAVVLPASVNMIADSAFASSGITTIYSYRADSTVQAEVAVTSSGNSLYKAATVYYYSATEPQAAGNFWQMVSGTPTAWPAYVPPAE